MFENGCYLRRQKRFKCGGKKSKNGDDLESKPKIGSKRRASEDEKPKSKRRNSINTSGTDLESSPVSAEMNMHEQYNRSLINPVQNIDQSQYAVKVEATYDQNHMVKTEAGYDDQQQQHQLPDQAAQQHNAQQQQQQLLALNQNPFGGMYPLVLNPETAQYSQENYMAHSHPWGWNSHHLYPSAHLTPVVSSMAASIHNNEPSDVPVNEIINQATDDKTLSAY